MSRSLTVVMVGVLVTASAVGALVTNKMKVTNKCKDVRVGMDGAIDAVVETGGLTSPHSQVTLFKAHNLKRYRIATLPVIEQKIKNAEVYAADDLKLIVQDIGQLKNGRSPASLEGVVDGEKVRVTLGCGQ